MTVIARDDSPPGGHLVTHKLRSNIGVDAQCFVVHVLTNCNILHLGSDNALSGIVALSALAFRHPRLAQPWQSLLQIDVDIRITVRATSVVDKNGSVVVARFLAVGHGYGWHEAYASHTYTQKGVVLALKIYFLGMWIMDFDILVHSVGLIILQICCISFIGLSARTTHPLSATPSTPVDKMSGISSRVIPPMAMRGS